MRDSGIPWLGAVPQEWEMVPAKHLFGEETTKNKDGEYTRQLSFRYGEIVDKGPNQSHNASPEETVLTYTVVEPNTIMINGLNLNYDLLSQRVAMVKEKGIITSAYLALLPLVGRILPWYALYLLKAYDFRMVFHGQGSGIRMTLKYADFATLPVILPPLAEQRAIADYLDEKCAAIDAAVAEAKRGIEEYKAWKKSLIFEAVTGKIAAGGSRSCATVSATTDARERVPPARPMRDSGIPWLGAVPQEWEICRVKDVAVIKTGNTPEKQYQGEYYSSESGVPWIKAENLGYITPISKTAEYLTPAGEEEGRVFPAHSIFVCCIASIGKVGYSDVRASCNQQINATLFSGRMHWKYGFYATIAAEEEYLVRASGNVVKILNSCEQGLIPLPLPPIAEQRAIADYLDRKCAAIDAMVTEKESLIADLEAYKESLIYETVTGKREVA